MRVCYIDKETRAIADLDPPENHLCGKGWLITRINVPFKQRGKGLARQLLKQILADADREGVRLFLYIVPSGGLVFEELEAWYMRHGFKPNRWSLYIRRPRKGALHPQEKIHDSTEQVSKPDARDRV